MLIGVCFFGRIRHFEHKFLLNSFGPTHTYECFYSGDNEPEDSVAEFQRSYPIISLTNETISYDIDLSKYPTKNKTVIIDKMTRHFINKKRVFSLLEDHCKKTNTPYDLIVSCRLDLHMDAYSPEIPLANTIYIPDGHDHTGINDQFAFGDLSTMKHYMNLYDTCLSLLETTHCEPHPETLHLQNIIQGNITVKRIQLNTHIVR
jgi:hypothetical protein